MKRVESMKANGTKTNETEEGLKYSQMDLGTLGNIKIIKLMDREFILGQMVKFMMENGSLE